MTGTTRDEEDGALPAALRQHAAQDADAVIATVRKQAVARLTAALADRYTDALMRRIVGAEEPQETPTVAAVRERRRGCYVYAVLAGDGTGAVTGHPGVQGATVTLLSVDGLCALVSDVDVEQLAQLSSEEAVDDASPLAVAVRAHDAVVDAAFRAGAVIPLRFGTVVADQPAATEMLCAHAGTLRAELRRIAQTAEWSVKVVADDAADAEAPVPAAAAATGRDYLTLLGNELQVRAQSRRQADETATLVHRALSELAVDAVRGHGAGDGAPVLKATYLVRRDDAERFVARCDEMRDTLSRQGLSLECTGPWPAYHFVDVRLEDAVR
jgi:hypothetical protein